MAGFAESTLNTGGRGEGVGVGVAVRVVVAVCVAVAVGVGVAVAALQTTLSMLEGLDALLGQPIAYADA